jgi:bifunctional UDP-N-acetylglucosamine pyrophosphorylase/glucosamine-1-phosphate N-acetyltransferase
MHKWVALAFKDGAATYCPYDGGEVAAAVRPYLDDAEYTAVLYSDTPLFRRKTLLEILNFVKANDLNVCCLTRGWIFSTNYLKKIEKAIAPKIYYFNEEDFMTATDFNQVALINDVLSQRIKAFHMGNGVYIKDPATAYIDGDVAIGKGVVIEPSNTLRGRTRIGDGAHLNFGNVITDSVIGENAVVTGSNLNGCAVGAGTSVGPYAYIRPHTEVGERCRIGDFTELKNAKIGDGTKVSHLSYVGDAEVGKDCNIGCGAVFVNYDGRNKYRTRVGDGAFIGSNCNLIAPVSIGDRAFIAAGSTITDDIPGKALAIARSRQVNKDGWNVDKYGTDKSNE